MTAEVEAQYASKTGTVAAEQPDASARQEEENAEFLHSQRSFERFQPTANIKDMLSDKLRRKKQKMMDKSVERNFEKYSKNADSAARNQIGNAGSTYPYLDHGNSKQNPNNNTENLAHDGASSYKYSFNKIMVRSTEHSEPQLLSKACSPDLQLNMQEVQPHPHWRTTSAKDEVRSPAVAHVASGRNPPSMMEICQV